MTVDRHFSAPHRLRLAAAALLLVPLLAMPATVSADDVPETARSAYDAGRSLLAKGGDGNLQRAFAVLDVRKDEALDSIAYWTLYARVWIAAGKDPQELWNVVCVQRQEAAPTSIVFDLVRARLADTPARKRAAVEAALKRDPKSVLARTEKALLLLDEDEDDEAAALLEEVLEDEPHALGALLAMARLDLSDGLPEDALVYCEKAREKHNTAELHHLMTQCFRRLARNKPEAIKDALASATEAMGLDPSEERIRTFNELLEQTGDAATAAKALRKHFERTKHPMLGALLAEHAFKAGDYEAALLGLAAGDASDLVTAKALAVAHARLGHVAPARAAAQRVIAVDSRGQLFAASLDLYLGDADAAKKRLGALADPESRRLRALAHAWRGEADAVKALVGKQVVSGSREGEALLIAWLQARMLGHMDPDLAEALRKKLLKARFEAGRKAVAQEERHSVDLGKAVTAGWAIRAVSWFRSRCGTFFRPSSDGVVSRLNFDGNEIYPTQQVIGEATCGDDEANCTFRFNGKKPAKSSGSSGVVLFGETVALKDFAPAEKAFAAGCKHYVEGRLEKAENEFLKALTVEPNWSRLKVLRAVMRALGPDSEKRDEARAAREAVKPWTDDFELRRLVIFVRAWAGDAELQAEVDALAAREAQYNVRTLPAL